MFINGKDFNNDQPVKISRIELVENKLNTILPAELKSDSQQLENSNLGQPLSTSTPPKPNPNEKEIHGGDQSSIVTADYIQQSKKKLEEISYEDNNWEHLILHQFVIAISVFISFRKFSCLTILTKNQEFQLVTVDRI